MKALGWFSKRNFTRSYADGRQKKGGKLYQRMQERTNGVDPDPVKPQPSIHAKMRKAGIDGPAHGTKARKRFAKQRTIRGIADRVKERMAGATKQP